MPKHLNGNSHNYNLLTAEGHTHKVFLNIQGNGVSSRNNDHVHKVKNRVVSRAGKNNHTHKLRKKNNRKKIKKNRV